MQYLLQTEQLIHHYSHYTLYMMDLWNQSTYTLTIQHQSCKQTHVHFMMLTDVKDKDEPEDRPGAVYKIKCSNCQAI